MTQDRCPACGAAVSGGRGGCQALFDEQSAAVYTDTRRAAVHDLFVDAYCMQHAEEYGRSAKSYAAHLMRLCCGVEMRGDATTYAAIRRWLDGASSIARPEPPAMRGTMTIVDIAGAAADQYADAVRAWASDVWAAYAGQHVVAREWIASAIERGTRR
jgi:hypothetical protein